jgi:hypothetical protein
LDYVINFVDKTNRDDILLGMRKLSEMSPMERIEHKVHLHTEYAVGYSNQPERVLRSAQRLIEFVIGEIAHSNIQSYNRGQKSVMKGGF